MRNLIFLSLVISFGYLNRADASPWSFELGIGDLDALVVNASGPEGLVEPLFATSRSREGYVVGLVSLPPACLTRTRRV